MREKIMINNGWLFSHEFDKAMTGNDYDEANMEKVRLPHNNKELAFSYINEEDYQEICGYRYHLFGEKAWEGKAVTITFLGAAHEAVLYVNGEEILTHSTGYTAFSAEISDKLKLGEDNIIALSVDSREALNTPPFGKVIDYMTYGGIYREAFIEVHEKVYLSDVYVMPVDVKKESSRLKVRLEMAGATPDELKDYEYRIRLNKLEAGEGAEAQRAEMPEAEVPETETPETEAPETETPETEAQSTDTKEKTEKTSILGNISGTVTEKIINCKRVNLWSPESPNLYRVTIEIYKDDELIDSRAVRTGFRTAVFRKDGFYLNGRKYKIRGIDRHQCYPYVGYAMPKSMQVMDADIIKNELSLNAVRTSHYPQSHDFLDRCDEIGILVFTEFPGWQHIGDEAWKEQAVENVREMVTQYRNHTSIILWGVRINESPDDDEFYERTNQVAHELDPYRATGGVRNFAKSNLLEDVYTYNDFSHTGKNPGCDPKKKITSDMDKAYLISEYNGHMYPTKVYDCEEHRLEHALRHARVINAAAREKDISGSFGWCMFDYNTHKDFGSGDRICHHGIMDMFRNPKLAAAVYESQGDPDKRVTLTVSSSMDIGEHPAGNLGSVYAFTNADSVKVYKNDEFIKEYTASDTEFKDLPHGAILIDDFIGEQLVEKEGFPKKQADMIKGLLLDFARYGMNDLPVKTKLNAAKLMTAYKMTYDDGVNLFGKYVGNWGGFVTTYRFDAIYKGEVAASVTKTPANKVMLKAKVDHTELCDKDTYDVAAIRISAVDENDNLCTYFQEPVIIKAEGPVEIIGPSIISLKGGMGGTYVKTLEGQKGEAKVSLISGGIPIETVQFDVI